MRFGWIFPVVIFTGPRLRNFDCSSVCWTYHSCSLETLTKLATFRWKSHILYCPRTCWTHNFLLHPFICPCGTVTSSFLLLWFEFYELGFFFGWNHKVHKTGAVFFFLKLVFLSSLSLLILIFTCWEFGVISRPLCSQLLSPTPFPIHTSFQVFRIPSYSGTDFGSLLGIPQEI